MRTLAESIVRILWPRRNLHDACKRLETRELIHYWARVARSN